MNIFNLIKNKKDQPNLSLLENRENILINNQNLSQEDTNDENYLLLTNYYNRNLYSYCCNFIIFCSCMFLILICYLISLF